MTRTRIKQVRTFELEQRAEVIDRGRAPETFEGELGAIHRELDDRRTQANIATRGRF